jgi:hypothetical protein
MFSVSGVLCAHKVTHAIKGWVQRLFAIRPCPPKYVCLMTLLQHFHDDRVVRPLSTGRCAPLKPVASTGK